MNPISPVNLIDISTNGTAKLRDETLLPESVLHQLDSLLLPDTASFLDRERLSTLDLLAAAGGSLGPDTLAALEGISRRIAAQRLMDLQAWMRIDSIAGKPSMVNIDMAGYIQRKRPVEITDERRRILALADQFDDGTIRDSYSAGHEIYTAAVRAASAMRNRDALFRNALRIAVQQIDSPASNSPETFGQRHEEAICIVPYTESSIPFGSIERQRQLVLGQIACAMAVSGKPEEASRLLGEIHEPVALAWSSTSIVAVLSRQEPTHLAHVIAESALSACRDLNDQSIRSTLNLRLIEPFILMARHDLLRKGLTLIDDSPEERHQKKTAIELAVHVCIQRRLFREALAYAGVAEDPIHRMGLLVDLLVAVGESVLTSHELEPLAKDAIEEIIRIGKDTSGYMHASLLIDAALNLRGKGPQGVAQRLVHEAVRRTEEVLSPPSRLDLEMRLCPAMILHGFANDAVIRLDRLWHLLGDEDRLIFLPAMGSAFRSVESKEHAENLLLRAVKIFEADKEKKWSAEVLSEFGAAAITLGHDELGFKAFQRVLDAVNQKSNPRMIRWDLRVVGKLLGCLARPHVLKDLVGILHDPLNRDFLRKVAVRQVLGLGWKPCTKWVGETNEEGLRAKPDSLIIAMAIARGIVSEITRDEILGLVCERLMQEERHQTALEVVREMTLEKNQIEYDARIFQSMGIQDLRNGGPNQCQDRLRSITSERNRSAYGCGMASALDITKSTESTLEILIPLITGYPALIASALKAWLLRGLFIEGMPPSGVESMMRSLEMTWVVNHI